MWQPDSAELCVMNIWWDLMKFNEIHMLRKAVSEKLIMHELQMCDTSLSWKKISSFESQTAKWIPSYLENIQIFFMQIPMYHPKPSCIINSTPQYKISIIHSCVTVCHQCWYSPTHKIFPMLTTFRICSTSAISYISKLYKAISKLPSPG